MQDAGRSGELIVRFIHADWIDDRYVIHRSLRRQAGPYDDIRHRVDADSMTSLIATPTRERYA